MARETRDNGSGAGARGAPGGGETGGLRRNADLGPLISKSGACLLPLSACGTGGGADPTGDVLRFRYLFGSFSNLSAQPIAQK
jgi:hypothetical protein